jgi:hypothetical protein
MSKVKILALAALVQIIENIAAHDPDQLMHDRGCPEENDKGRVISGG